MTGRVDPLSGVETAEDLKSLVADARQTEREVGQALLHITMVVMVASLAASGVAGYHLYGGSLLGGVELALVAVAIDNSMFRWLRISKRLRKRGTITKLGERLDWISFFMACYLNTLAVVSMLVPALTPFAFVLMGIAHLFIPVIYMACHKAMPGAQMLLQELAERASAKLAVKEKQEIDERNAANERVARDRDAVRISDNERIESENYARVRPLEIDRENKEREGKQRDLDRAAGEREQIRVHTISLASYLFLARRLQAAALAVMHAGSAPSQARPNGVRNGSPGAVTSPSPARHQVGSPGPSPGSSPARHQVPPPASPGDSPGGHQAPPRTPRKTPAPGTTGAASQVAPDIAILADLAESWLEANPAAGRTRLVKHLVNLVTAPGEQAGDPLVNRLVTDLVNLVGDRPGDRITDHTGKLVQAELKKRRDRREIAQLEKLLSE